MLSMSTIRKDFVASHLRAQLFRLRNVLNNVEGEEEIDCGYAYENLKQIEESLRQIRKLCMSN